MLVALLLLFVTPASAWDAPAFNPVSGPSSTAPFSRALLSLRRKETSEKRTSSPRMQKWDWMRGSSDISSLFNQKVNKTPQELPADVMLIVNHPEYRGVQNMTRAIKTMRETWNWRKACEMVINTPETLLDMRVYNSLVSDCAKENTTILGVSLVASMRKAGATPDIVTYGNLIQGYANERNLEKAMQVYEFEKKLGLEPGLPTTKIFAKAADNNFPAEGKYFDMIISSCAKAKKMKECFRAIEKMEAARIPVNLVTAPAIIETYRTKVRPEIGLGYLAKLQSQGIKPDAATYNALIFSIADRNATVAALGFLRMMIEEGTQPDHFTWDRLVSTCSEFSLLEKVLEAMQPEEGMTPGVDSYNKLISSCVEADNADNAMKVYNWMPDGGMEPDLLTFNSLIIMCAKDPEPDRAQMLYKEMKSRKITPDYTTYDNMILATSKPVAPRLFSPLKAQPMVSLKIFDEMRNEDMTPSVDAYNEMIIALAREKETSKAVEVLTHMQVKGMLHATNVTVWNQLVIGATEEGTIDRALELFSDMEEMGFVPDVEVYNKLIKSCSEGPRIEKGVKVVESCQRNRIWADVDSYRSLFSAATLGGHPDKALEVYALMQDAQVLQELAEHQPALEGYFENALEAVGFDPTVIAYNELISARLRRGRGR